MLLLLLPPALLQRYFITTTAHFVSLEIYSGITRFLCDSPALLFTLVLNNSNNKYSWTCPTENRQCSAALHSAAQRSVCVNGPLASSITHEERYKKRAGDALNKVATHLENLEKSGNFTLVRVIKLGKLGKAR